MDGWRERERDVAEKENKLKQTLDATPTLASSNCSYPQ